MQRQPERIAASFGHFIAGNQAAAIACIYPFAAFASGRLSFIAGAANSAVRQSEESTALQRGVFSIDGSNFREDCPRRSGK
jgi:hypothetical protein